MAHASRDGLSDDLVAKLTRAAYQVALRHGLQGPFIDVELDLWHALERVAREEADTDAAMDACSVEAFA